MMKIDLMLIAAIGLTMLFIFFIISIVVGG